MEHAFARQPDICQSGVHRTMEHVRRSASSSSAVLASQRRQCPKRRACAIEIRYQDHWHMTSHGTWQHFSPRIKNSGRAHSLSAMNEVWGPDLGPKSALYYLPFDCYKPSFHFKKSRAYTCDPQLLQIIQKPIKKRTREAMQSSHLYSVVSFRSVDSDTCIPQSGSLGCGGAHASSRMAPYLVHCRSLIYLGRTMYHLLLMHFRCK